MCSFYVGAFSSCFVLDLLLFKGNRTGFSNQHALEFKSKEQAKQVKLIMWAGLTGLTGLDWVGLGETG